MTLLKIIIGMFFLNMASISIAGDSPNTDEFYRTNSIYTTPTSQQHSVPIEIHMDNEESSNCCKGCHSTHCCSNDACALATLLCGAGTCGVLCTGMAVGLMFAAPILAGYSDQSKQIALASAIWNTILTVGSCETTRQKEDGTTRSTSGSISGISLAATFCAWFYWNSWDNPNNSLRIANIALMSLNPAIAVLALCCFGCVAVVGR